MKTCNNGYCDYRTLNGINFGCKYEGYCDFQRPLDSRVEPLPTVYHYDFCLCAGETNSAGICSRCGKRKH